MLCDRILEAGTEGSIKDHSGHAVMPKAEMHEAVPYSVSPIFKFSGVTGAESPVT